jgi:hypothetical protein
MPDFHKDLQDGSEQGARLSELLNQYLSEKQQLSTHDKERNRRLGASVGEGLQGLGYLTGFKQPEVDTFYDKHPAQAVARNAADSAPALGAGVAVGGTAANFLKDMYRNHQMRGIESNLQEGGDKGGFIDLHSSPDGEGKGKGSRHPSDFENVFGKGEKAHEDLMESFKGTGTQDPDALKGKVNAYTRFYSTLRKMPRSGSMLPPTLGPGGNEEVARMVESNLPRQMGGSRDPLNTHLIQKMLLQHLGGNHERASDITDSIRNRHEHNSVSELAGRSFGGGTPSKAHGFLHSAVNKGVGMLPKSFQEHRVNPATLRNFSRAKTPGMIGGAMALGGMALSPVLKAIHQRTYGNDQVKDWTTAIRQTKGKFSDED